jgi:hypothetical protein
MPDDSIERNLGPQPLVDLLSEHDLSVHDVVAASTEQLTHKMVTRGCKGRRLTPNTKGKILRALRAATGRDLEIGQLFNYT